MAQKEVIGKVVVLGVRASFLSLFEPNVQEQDDGSERKTWKGNFLIDKEKAKAGEIKAVFNGKRMSILAALKAAGAEAKTKKWGEESKWPKLKADRTFLRDGDQEDWDGYEGNYYISSNAQIEDKPAVVTNRRDGNGKWIPAEPGGNASPYSGCYVNATIIIWAQDNKHGKRLNAQLRAVQFFADGEAFGAAPTNPNDDFDDDMVGETGDFGGDDDGDDDDSMI